MGKFIISDLQVLKSTGVRFDTTAILVLIKCTQCALHTYP